MNMYFRNDLGVRLLEQVCYKERIRNVADFIENGRESDMSSLIRRPLNLSPVG